MAGERRISRSLECDGMRAGVELLLEGERATYRIESAGAETLSGALEWQLGPGGEIRIRSEDRSAIATLFRTREALWIHADGRTWCFRAATTTRTRAKASSVADGPELRAPMTGTVRRIAVAPGELVERGAPLLALEAMKMEHLLRAPRDVKIASVHCREGETVDLGSLLLSFDEDDGAQESPVGNGA